MKHESYLSSYLVINKQEYSATIATVILLLELIILVKYEPYLVQLGQPIETTIY